MAVWEHFTSQKQWRQYLQELLRTNNVALIRATALIYDNQTDEEKYRGESTEDNNVGFSKYDAKQLTECALKIKQGRRLTRVDMETLRNKMPKYWKQLMVISKRRMAEEKEKAKQQRIVDSHISIQHGAFARCMESGMACDYGICSECNMQFHL